MTNSLRPTQKQERLDLLDALRGFALCGILLANLEGFTGAYLLTPAETAAQPVTRAVLFLINWFIEGKFYALFSMLFGMGFALQITRVQQAGASFLPLWQMAHFGPGSRRRMSYDNPPTLRRQSGPCRVVIMRAGGRTFALEGQD